MASDPRIGPTASAGAGFGGAGRSLVCPVLIGRDGPATRLRALVDEVAGGERRLALVAGEAGLGKSRLVAETMAYAEERGFRVLAGASFPRDRTSPFAPIVDLLRAGLDALPREEVAALVRPFARELAPLLPDLVTVPRGLAAASAEPDVERERRQLFAALAHCLLGPSSEQTPGRPTCLVLEDLHWCDDVSLDLLDFLARGLARGSGRQPLLILATYRVDDAEPSLRGWLAQLDRARLADEVTLAPLTRDETLEMLGVTFAGARLPTGLVDAIHALAEGNPFRVEELLGSLVAAGEVVDDGGVWRWSARPVESWRLPRSLYEAVQERVARLSSSARELLTLAAVMGRRFDFELLQRAAQVDERALLALVKELVAARMVVEEAGDRFAFRHALTRQAVYGELLARERVALHRTVGEMAEQLYADALDPHVVDLAGHFAEAGSWEKALTYARLAAERARRLYAPRVVVEQLTRAIDACQRLPGDRAGTLAALHLERARANDTVGDAPAAIADARMALDLAHQAGDRHAEWAALLDLGLYWAGRDYARAGPCLEAALDLARSLDDPAKLAHSLNRFGNWRVNAEQPRDALPLHREALAIFEALGDRAGVAATLDLLGMAAFLSADLAGTVAYYERAAALFEELDDRRGLVTCLAMLSGRGGSSSLGSATTDAADFATGLRDGERAISLAREIGWPAGEAFALAQLAFALCAIGEYSRSLDLAERGQAIAQSIDHVQWDIDAHALLGALYLDVLAFERASTHFERALALGHEIRSTFWIQMMTGEFAWCHILAAQIRTHQARTAALARAAALLGETPDGDRPVGSLGERWITFAHAYLAQARNDPALSLRLFDRVTAPSVDAAPGDTARPSLTPRPALGRATALLALERYDEAEAILLGVLEVVQRQGARPLIWRCQLALGDLYEQTGRPDLAQHAYLTARQVVEALAAGLPDPDLREQFSRRMLSLLPRAYRPTARQASAASREGGLTAREREVAVMIAAGKTNREIAEALVLGERTIETHVSNILGKLDVASRREVARWAARHGLAG